MFFSSAYGWLQLPKTSRLWCCYFRCQQVALPGSSWRVRRKGSPGGSFFLNVYYILCCFTCLHFIITLPCYVIDVWNAQVGCLCTAITNIFVPIRNQEHSCIHGAHSHLQDFGPLVHMHARNVLEMKRDCLNFIFNAPEFAMYLFTVCTIALSFLVPHTFRETL